MALVTVKPTRIDIAIAKRYAALRAYVTGPEPASLAVLQGPPSAMAELTARRAPTNFVLMNMTLLLLIWLCGAGLRHFAMLLRQQLRRRYIRDRDCTLFLRPVPIVPP